MPDQKEDFYAVYRALCDAITVLNKVAFSMQRIQDTDTIAGYELLLKACDKSADKIRNDLNA